MLEVEPAQVGIGSSWVAARSRAARCCTIIVKGPVGAVDGLLRVLEAVQRVVDVLGPRGRRDADGRRDCHRRHGLIEAPIPIGRSELVGGIHVPLAHLVGVRLGNVVSGVVEDLLEFQSAA